MPKIDVNKVAEILKKNEISPAVLRRVLEEFKLYEVFYRDRGQRPDLAMSQVEFVATLQKAGRA